MLNLTVTAQLSPLTAGLERNLSAAARKLETEVLRSCEPFVPYNTGRLCASGHASGSGTSGEVVWDAAYAAECYNASREFNHRHHPRACARWFEAAKASDLPLWIDAVKEALSLRVGSSGAVPTR